MDKKENKLLICFLYSLGLLVFTLLLKPFIFYLLKFNNNGHLLMNSLYWIISLISCLIFFLNLKKKNDLKQYLKVFISGISVILLYFFMSELAVVPLMFFDIDPDTMSSTNKIVYLCIYEAIFIGIIILILKDKIKRDIVDIKSNNKIYFSKYLKYWFISLIVMSASNIIINAIQPGLPANEETIRTMMNQYPIYIFISSVIFAPLLEELVFRQGFRNVFSNDKLFIVASGIVFGSMHVLGNINSWIDLLYLIPYCAPGIAFAYILSKTNNIFVTIGIHLLHNGIMISLQILIMILGLLA